MTDVATKPITDRAHVGNVTLSIGMLSTLGNLYTVARAPKDEFKTACPTCKAPTVGLSQRYICTENAKHGPFILSETKLGKEDGDKFVVVERGTVSEARESVLPEKALELQVHERADVGAQVLPRGNLYVFRPAGKSPLYGILIDLLQKRPDLILLAKTNLRKSDHLVMVDLVAGQLVVKEMTWPSETKPFEVVVTEPSSPKLLAQAEMLLEASVEPFVPTEYEKDSKARIAAVVEEASNGTATKKTPAKKKPAKLDETDMMELMAQAIAAKKGKKTA